MGGPSGGTAPLSLNGLLASWTLAELLLRTLPAPPSSCQLRGLQRGSLTEESCGCWPWPMASWHAMPS